MPEMPEVETVRRTLNNLIKNETIRDIDVFYDKMIRSNTVYEFKQTLQNKTLKIINRVGKHLLFEFDDIILISHLRMEGKFFIKNADEPRTKHEHVIFYFESGKTLRYHDTRKFGTMDLFKKETLYEKESPLYKLGYEPSDTRLTLNYLKKRLASKNVPIKGALLDQSIITGLGNIYVDEVLFLSKINPNTKSKDLKDIDLKNIIKNSEIVIDKAIELGGTTIRSYTSSLGVTGRFQNELNVHTKAGEPCPVCGSTIIKTKVVGRGTYLCPECQK